MGSSKLIYTDVRRCEHCGNKTPMSEIGVHRIIGRTDIEMIDHEVYLMVQTEKGQEWAILLCPVCLEVIILRSDYILRTNPNEEGEVAVEQDNRVSERGDVEVIFPGDANSIVGTCFRPVENA